MFCFRHKESVHVTDKVVFMHYYYYYYYYYE